MRFRSHRIVTEAARNAADSRPGSDRINQKATCVLDRLDEKDGWLRRRQQVLVTPQWCVDSWNGWAPSPVGTRIVAL